VDSSNLQTQIIEEHFLNCKTISKAEFITNRSTYQTLLYSLYESPVDPNNAGLTTGKNISQGSFLTIDLCPTEKSLVRSLFDQFTTSENNPVNVNISISGYWLKNHEVDFQWLINEQSSKRLNITWVNHSYSHPYIRNIKSSENFFFLPNVNVRNEILKTEILLLQNGIVPTVFFRFPGLVANKELIQVTSSYGLISLGSDSWLNIGGRPKTGSFILVHGNGNELGGLAILSNLFKKNKIPLPFLSLFELGSGGF
jgi:hypothetical protein